MLTFGDIIALSPMGSVFNDKMSVDGPAFSMNAHASSLQSIASLPPEVQAAVRARAGSAVMWAFVAVAPFMWVAVILAGMLENVCLDKGEAEGEDTLRSMLSENILQIVWESSDIVPKHKMVALPRISLFI